jgi:Bacteriophage Sf6, terminase small subunit-like
MVTLMNMKNDELNESRVGRPTKYNEKTITRLCEALADGMPIKAACVVAGIGVTTLAEWRDKYPEIEDRMSQARERYREKALQTIKSAVEAQDWRAAVAALKLIFPEYRDRATDVNVAVGVQVVLAEAERQKLLERRDKALLALASKSGQTG